QRRPDEELPTRVDRRRGVGPDDRLRLVAEAAGGLLLHEDQGGGTVGERRGVAGGDGAVAAVAGRFQPGELLERRVGPREGVALHHLLVSGRDRKRHHLGVVYALLPRLHGPTMGLEGEPVL